MTPAQFNNTSVTSTNCGDYVKRGNCGVSQYDTSIFSKPDAVYANLNQGVFNDIRGGDVSWYYGKLIDGKPIVITSKKTFFQDTRVKINGTWTGEDGIREVLRLDYQHKLAHNPGAWSNKSILEWFEQGYTVDLLPLFENIRDEFTQYMEFQEDAQYDICAIYVIKTYCFELFETSPLLLLNGMRESGKSKAKKLIRLMSFHGREASNISESALFRSITESKPCLCFDEYEDMDTDRKKYCDQLLNAGIEKGATVLRSDSNPTGWVSRDYDVFCPKVVANISGLNDVTLSRAIPIYLMRTTTSKGKLRPRTADPLWQEARNDCHVAIMDHWREILAAYESFSEPGLANRQEDIWRPILAIASCVEKEVYDRILFYAQDTAKENAVECYDSDWDYVLLDVLRENVSEEGWFWIDDVKHWLNERLNLQKPITERWIGKRLKNFHQFKRRRTTKLSKLERKDKTEYFLSPALIENRIKRRYGVITADNAVSAVTTEGGGVQI